MRRFFALAACAAALGLAGCLEEDAPAASDVSAGDAAVADPSAIEAPTVPVKLYAMECGRIAVSDAAMFSDEHVYDGQARDLVNPCYLIRHPSGDLIWDTGLGPAVHDAPDGVTRGPFHMTLAVTLPSQLETLGLTPADIEYVAISHSHSDHVGNLNLFAGSTWIVDSDEREWMFREEARAEPAFETYNQMENARTELIEEDAVYDVFRDGSVMIYQTPGHTPGHTSLLVKLPGYGPALLAGDMYHLREAREKRTVPTGNTDRDQTLASMDTIEELARANGAKVIRQHVPDDFASMPAFPMAAE